MQSLGILVRDMPYYSKKFFTQWISPSWKFLVQLLPLYNEVFIFGKTIEYDEYEQKKIIDDNYIYERGYESENDDEKYGIEGLVTELIDFTSDLLKRKNILLALRNSIFTFLLFIKDYCVLSEQSV